jgi:hypothetical protein
MPSTPGLLDTRLGRPGQGRTNSLDVSVELLLAGTLMASAVLAAMAALPRGLDLTDEGSHLHIIAFPTLYFRVSQFGFVFNPIFNFLDHDIVLFRFFGFISMVLLSVHLFWRVLALLRHDVCRLGTKEFIILLLIFGCSGILFYKTWLPTPNYNTLNMYGALLVAAGLVPRPSLAFASGPRPIGLLIADGSLVAIGLAVCFLAKPTTPVVLAPLVLLNIARLDRRVLFATTASGGAIAIVMATLLAIDSTPHAIIERYSDERGWRLILQSGHDLASLLSPRMPILTGQRLLSLLLTIAAGFILAGTADRSAWRPTFAARAVALLFVVLAAGTIGIHFYATEWNLIFPLTIPVFAVASAGYLIATGRQSDARNDWRLLTTGGVLMAIPIAVGFGSAATLPVSASLAAVFWIAGTLLLIGGLSRGPLARHFMMATALVTSIVCVSVLAGTWIRPHRIPTPLWEQTEWISVRDHDRAVQVDAATAAYFRQFRAAAERNGFADGTPIIDLTGMSPTTVYALGGSALGAAWLLGGLPGSSEFVALILARMRRADLERAWILTAPSGHRRVDVSVLTRNGLAFPEAYAEVGWATSGYMSEIQILWKPVQ